MITCNLMGGLGNQLFQIFATISYAIKSKNQFKFLNISTLKRGITIRYTFWNSFLNRLKPFLIDNIPQSVIIIREKEFAFNELPINKMLGNDVLISGYFQSYKYFEENYEMITKIIGLEISKTMLLEKMQLNNSSLENTISMHFRIGDYKKIQDFHPIIPKEYYLKCLQFINDKYENNRFTVIYFCEDVDIEDVKITIDFLKTQIANCEFIRGENKLNDWEQMLFMSCCHHNIIANSTFSWWAAYFNSWKDKTICYPSIWFGPSAKHSSKDLCPPEWVKIEILF
jgi:hypothetical protein